MAAVTPIMLALLFGFGDWCAADPPPALKFEQSKGRPPSARVGDFVLAFTTNGAFVLHRNGRTVMDGGVTYREKGWEKWGSQIRRTSDDDECSLLEDGRKLAFRSKLRDLQRKEVFAVQEEVLATDDGFKFSYQLKALASFAPEIIGVEFHLPIEEVHAKARQLAFGGPPVSVPVQGAGALLGVYQAAEFSLVEARTALVKVVLPSPLRWFALDDRPFNLNLARSQFVLAPKPQVQEGEEIQLSFVLKLDVARDDLTVRIGTTRWLFDETGRFTLEVPGGRCKARLCLLDEEDPETVGTKDVLLAEEARPIRAEDGTLYLSGKARLDEKAAPFPFRLKVSARPTEMSMLYRFRKGNLAEVKRLGLFLDTQGIAADVSAGGGAEGETSGDWMLTLPGADPIRLILPAKAAIRRIEEGEGQPPGVWFPLAAPAPVGDSDVVSATLLFQVSLPRETK